MSDPRSEIDTAWKARVAGTMGEADYLATVDRLAPQIGQVPENAPTPQEARSTADDLRQQRIDGKIGQSEYLERMGRLAPIAEHAKPAGATEAQLVEEIMAPATSPHEYRIDYPQGAPQIPEDIELDGAIREALRDTGIPPRLGGPVVDAINALSRKLSNASDLDRASHVHRVGTALQERWGDQYDSKLALVDGLIEKAAEKHPVLANIVDEAPWLLADVGVSEWLLSVAEHRSKKNQEPVATKSQI